MIHAKELIDMERGYQSRRVFWDEEVYRQELARIFARSWLFLAHECEIPNPGDFVSRYMGQDAVIVARQKDKSIKAFANSCTHRGNKLCFADAGNTQSFSCNYHGWSFGLDGSLVGVPLEKEAYHNKIDKAALAAHPVAKVESFHGLIFGNFDPEAPSLRDYLGEMAWYFDIFMDEEVTGGIELLGPPMKSILKSNWKVPIENFACDAYHVGWTHGSAIKLMESFGGRLVELLGNANYDPGEDIQVTTRGGHGFGCLRDQERPVGPALHPTPAYMDYVLKKRPIVEAKKGKAAASLYGQHWDGAIFPNCTYLYGTNTFKVWIPKGPMELEVWTWTMVEKDMPTELKEEIRKGNMMTFGTAGMLESDDGENMEQCTRINQGYVIGQDRLFAGMSLGMEKPHPEFPGLIGQGTVSEVALRGFYRRWMEMMDAQSWQELKALDSKKEVA
jgi:3-phenylpropionate/trans-cinnamate dioxygenase alpha subunit